MPDHHRILILGGRTAGVTVTARLQRGGAQLGDPYGIFMGEGAAHGRRSR